MAAETLNFSQLIEQAKHQIAERQLIPPDLEEEILLCAEQEDPEVFKVQFYKLFGHYMQILGASHQDVELYSTQTVQEAFMITALLIQSGLKATRADVYANEKNTILEHYLQALKTHQYLQYFIEASVDQGGSPNPIWSVILSAVTA